MSSQDGGHVITFNGEVYNFLEIRRELEREGQGFVSQSDTEVLLSAYLRWGPEVLKRLVGMFAFCICDVRQRTLFLARDAFGIKPLYYARFASGFAFSSEISPLLELPGVSRAANPQRMYSYLRFGLSDHGCDTMFRDVRQLPAAHYMEVDCETLVASQTTRYWTPAAGHNVDLGMDAAAEKCRRLFLKSISLHLRSDVPVGTCLSGGVDSSGIVGAMRHLGGRDLDLHAFSLVPRDGVSEEPWIDLVASATQAVVHKTSPTGGELMRDLPSLISAQEEPFGSTGIYGQYRVFQMAQEAGIKVMLDGQGGDELFAGYRYFIPARLTSLLRSGKLAEFLQLLLSARRLPDMNAILLLIRTADNSLPSSIREILRTWVGKASAPSWINSQWFREREVLLEAPARRRIDTDQLLGELEMTLSATSVPHLLHWEDRNSMHFSVESRVPYLTTELADFAFSLPGELLISRDAVQKAVLRCALRGIVPDAVLDRRDKVGFATPEWKWLSDAAVGLEGVLFGADARANPLLRVPAMEASWAHFAQDGTEFGREVWRWFNLILWTRQFRVEYS